MYNLEYINKPFIHLKRPVVLEKKLLNSDNLITIYMAASYNSIMGPKEKEGDYIKRYDIFFSVINRNRERKSFPGSYNGYSIMVKKIDNEYKLCLDNMNLLGLDIIIYPQGIGIGSILLNHLFYWAKENYPDLPIPPLRLSPADEKDADNKIRRDRLYERIGLIGKGAKYISDLTPIIETRGFEIYPVDEFLVKVLDYRQEKMELEQQLGLKNKIITLGKQENKRNNHSIIFHLGWIISIVIDLLVPPILYPLFWTIDKLKSLWIFNKKIK